MMISIYQTSRMGQHYMRSALCLIIGLVSALFLAPAVNAQQTVDLTPIKDTYIVENASENNNGSADGLKMDGTSPGTQDVNGLIQWDLEDAFPSGATVTAVSLTINVTDDTDSDYWIYQLLSPWNEMQATWSSTQTGVSWATAGADSIGVDRANTILGTLHPTSNGEYTISLNASGIAVVQGWIDSPSGNHGFVIMNTDGASNLWFDSRDHGTIANRPTLSVTYSSSGPDPDLSSSESSFAYPNVSLGNTATRTFTITNLRSYQLTVTRSLAGTDPGEFDHGSISSGGETQHPSTTLTFDIPANESVGLDAIFKPTSLGVKTATLSLAVSGSSNPPLDIALTGDGVISNSPWTETANGDVIYFGLGTAQKVGIGTSDPQTYRLAVDGAIRTKEIRVNTGWSDFVFEDDYDLPTLEEVAAFIKDNKHLKDIPPANDVEENGVSLGEMQARLLQKIEELTLYVIELKKENAAIKNRLMNQN